MSYTSRRLRFALIMSLAASKRLRRAWFWGCWVLLVGAFALPYIGLLYVGTHPVGGQADTNRTQMLFFLMYAGVCAWLAGLGAWIPANIIRFFGKHVKDDHREGQVFVRERTSHFCNPPPWLAH